MAATGSFGDIFPMIGLGRALRDRGHEVTFVTSDHYRDHVATAGLRFVEDMTARATSVDHAIHGRTPPGGVDAAQAVRAPGQTTTYLRTVYASAEEAHERGSTVVLAFGAGVYAAMAANERLGVPWVRIYHVPKPLHRVQPKLRVPGRLNHAFLVASSTRLGWRLRAFESEVNRFREQLRLPPAADSRFDLFCPPALSYSPFLNLGLFPDWIAPWFREFPRNTVLTDFPRYDAGDDNGLPIEVQNFLSAGPEPIVFTVPSWRRNATDFFEQSIAACRSLGKRAILLWTDVDKLPQSDEHHLSVRYLPYNALLPRVSVFVHGGGAGAFGAALASGVPQLCVPSALDQPFNASMVKALGCGDVVQWSRYRSDSVASALRQLTRSQSVRERCQEYAERCQSGPGLNPGCQAIERLGARSGLLP